jgi:uncharacterized membrane protein
MVSLKNKLRKDKMLLNNPLQMNDWKFSPFIKLIICVQLFTLLMVGLTLKDINIPIITQLTGFIYLTFIPGYLILRTLRIHDQGSVKSLLYAVGLSVSSVMFLGFLMNMILPGIGISTPISTQPLMIVLTLYVIILSIFSYIRDKDFKGTSKIDTSALHSPAFYFLCLIPFLAVFGSYSMNIYNNNFLSMLLIGMIGLTLLLVVFDKISRKFYLFTVWIISISLLYMSSLISPYVWGWDIQNEYYLANLVINYSYWNFTLPDAYNSMLSIVMLAPVYSLYTNLTLDYVFKIISPFIFSLVPLGLYHIFKIQTDDSKIAFMAVFLFISFNTFYIELLSLTREMMAELFLVLLLLLILDRRIRPNLVVLMAFFSMGLVVSHYSTTYFFIAALLGVTVMLAIFNLSHFNISREQVNFTGNKKLLFILPSLTAFMILFTYIWYGSLTQGIALKPILDVLTYLKQDFVDLLNQGILKVGINPDNTIYGLLLVLVIVMFLIFSYMVNKWKNRFETHEHSWMKKIQCSVSTRLNTCTIAVIGIFVLILLTFFTGPPKTWIVTVLRYLNFTVVFFTLMGMALVFLQLYRSRFQNTYLAFSVVGIVMLIAGFIVPSFEGSFNITRIYEMAFIILSPFCVIGGKRIMASIYSVLTRDKMDGEKPLKLFSIFLLIFMLFNTGFVSVLAGQSVPMHLSGESTASDYYPRFNHQESYSALWLSQYMVSPNIYADVYGRFAFYHYIWNLNIISANNGVQEFTVYNKNDSYIYTRKLNGNNTFLVGFTSRNTRQRVYEDLSSYINEKYRIFDDGDSKIYYS